MIMYTTGIGYCDGHVLLILKNRGPDSVRGRLNGIGGKLESGETYEACQRREYREETGLDVEESRWKHTVTLMGRGWQVRFFIAELSTEEIQLARTMEDEPVGLFDILDLPDLNTVPNLAWIIPMSFDASIRFPIGVQDNRS